MHPDLEVIVSADEEARARLTLAGQRLERELAAARAARDAAIETRRRESSDALENELQAIRTEGDARVAELQRQQAQYVASLAEAGERAFDDATALYLRIVCEAAP
jgi:hypothetical protein